MLQGRRLLPATMLMLKSVLESCLGRVLTLLAVRVLLIALPIRFRGGRCVAACVVVMRISFGRMLRELPCCSASHSGSVPDTITAQRMQLEIENAFSLAPLLLNTGIFLSSRCTKGQCRDICAIYIFHFCKIFIDSCPAKWLRASAYSLRHL